MTPTTTELKVQYIPVTELKPDPLNPRHWPEKTIADLTKSIKEYDIVDPLLANGNEKRRGVLISGHFRLHVAKKLGYTKVPVAYIDISDIEKEKRLSLLLNRVQGSWNMELLKEFDIGLLLETGFDAQDLATIWDNALGIEDDNFDVRREIEELGEPTTKPGDLYALGSARLICGDGTDQAVVKRLASDVAIDAIYIDIPFNIGLSYDKGIGQTSAYGGTQTNDKKSDSEYRQFVKAILENALAVSSPDTHVFLYCDGRYIGMIQELYAELGIDFKRICLWIKGATNPTPQVAFNRSYEPVAYGTRGSPYLAKDVKNLTEVLNREVGNGVRVIDDILDLLDIWLVRRDPTAEYEHPTQKPTTLHEKPLRRCTKPGDAVLDLCAGSGSVLSACEQLKRRAFMCELEPRFCDVIIRRYEKLTGRKAKRLGRAK